MTLLNDFLYSYGRITDLVLLNCLLAVAAHVNFASGQFSVAVPAFAAIGAYASALLTMKMNVAFPLALLAAVVLPSIAASLFGLPVLRLQGVYLSMATLGFVEVVQILAVNLKVTGGAMGIMGIPGKTETWQFALALAAFLYLQWTIDRSKLGAGLRAMRHDWQLARVLGVDLVSYNMYAFVLSAAMAGLAGGLSAHANNAIAPGDYGFPLAVSVMSFCIIGGIGRLWGPILGAVLLTLLPAVARPLQEHLLVFNGIVLLVVILFLRRGLIGLLEDAWRLTKGVRGRWLFSR